jgi:hypothetical protein
MNDEAQAIPSLSQKDLELIEQIAARHSLKAIDHMYRSHERIESWIETRFDELEEKLTIEED